MSKTGNTGGKWQSKADEMAALLPFYLQNGLTQKDRQRVEAWLAEDGEHRLALARIETERAEAITNNEAITPPGGALGRFMESLEAEAGPEVRSSAREHATTRGGITTLGWLRRMLGAAPMLGWGVAALLLVASLTQGVILWRSLQSGPSYEIASGGAQESKGPTILVSFAAGASAAQINAALRAADATIISGPRGAGFYEIRLREGEGLPTVDDRLRALRANRAVIAFIQPIKESRR